MMKIDLSNMRQCAKLMRVKHYIKNFLILLPLFFNGSLFQVEKTGVAILGFICFSMTSSIVYILNDIKDVEKDRNHPKKRFRPIASRKISIKSAILLIGICMFVVVVLSLFINRKQGLWFLVLYLGINLAYSLGLKNYPIVDIVILASGFVIRILYGGVITGIEISKWLYLVIVSGSVFMGLGKRRNELKQQINTRDVLKYYNEAFLDKNMYMSLSCVCVFYALWTVEFSNPAITWTVPFLLIILIRYSYNIERTSDGDPVEVILHDKALIGLILVYAGIMCALLYT